MITVIIYFSFVVYWFLILGIPFHNNSINYVPPVLISNQAPVNGQILCWNEKTKNLEPIHYHNLT